MTFEASLAESHEFARLPWLAAAYKDAFPTLESNVVIYGDGWAQRSGIDRILTLSCGRIITIDEKFRKEKYGDILLEYFSDEARKSPGWILKPLNCEFIAYIIVPSSRLFLFPCLLLQRAFRLNKRDWWRDAMAERNGFSIRRSQNNGYTTANMAVPTKVLFEAMNEASGIVGNDDWLPPPANGAEP